MEMASPSTTGSMAAWQRSEYWQKHQLRVAVETGSSLGLLIHLRDWHVSAQVKMSVQTYKKRGAREEEGLYINCQAAPRS